MNTDVLDMFVMSNLITCAQFTILNFLYTTITICVKIYNPLLTLFLIYNPQLTLILVY